MEEGGETVLQGWLLPLLQCVRFTSAAALEGFLAEEFVPKKQSRGRAAVEVEGTCPSAASFPSALVRGEGGKLRILVMGGRENNVSIQMGGQGVLQVCLPGTCNSFLCDVFHKMPVFALLPLSKSLMEILNSTGCR